MSDNIDRTIAQAIQNLRPNSKWIMHNYDYDQLEWLEENTEKKPTKKQVESEIARIKELQYVNKRAAEYPSIGDQLDALFKAGVFPEEMAAKIQAIKDKYPKPEW